MKKENFSNRVILEVLIEEVQLLKNSSEVLKSIIPKLDNKISKIQNIKVGLNDDDVKNFQKEMHSNTENLSKILERTRQQANKYIAIPRSLLIAIIAVFFVTVISVSLNFYYRNEAKEWKASNSIWYEKAIELGYDNN